MEKGFIVPTGFNKICIVWARSPHIESQFTHIESQVSSRGTPVPIWITILPQLRRTLYRGCGPHPFHYPFRGVMHCNVWHWKSQHVAKCHPHMHCTGRTTAHPPHGNKIKRSHPICDTTCITSHTCVLVVRMYFDSFAEACIASIQLPAGVLGTHSHIHGLC